jgi:hypothetical protein
MLIEVSMTTVSVTPPQFEGVLLLMTAELPGVVGPATPPFQLLPLQFPPVFTTFQVKTAAGAAGALMTRRAASAKRIDMLLRRTNMMHLLEKLRG